MKDLLVPAEFIDICSFIHICREQEKAWKELAPDLLAKLRERSFVRSVASSNAIEGIMASERRIPGIVRHECSLYTENELQIAGYADALSWVRENHDSIPVNDETILHLHGMMYYHTSSADAGRYKTEDNVIAEVHADGSMYVRWKPVSHEETPYAMQQLLLSYTFVRNETGINQLLLIPCFILDFLCIHPFRDGNGRMSRLLTNLLLYQSGYDIPEYSSPEDWTYKDRDWYYRALQKSSYGLNETENDYIPFMHNFLATIFMCCKDLSGHFEAIREGANKNERIRRFVLGSIIPVSKQEICEALPDVSQTTVEAVLARC